MLDKEFWNNLYETAQTGWDIGFPSTPLKTFIDNIENKDKSILIPGCGRAYEAEYLHLKGFKKVTIIDLSPLALDAFSKRLPSFPKSQLIEGDFFEHQGQYDLILEQTFFCAIEHNLRKDYVKHTSDLLNKNGKVVGLLFAEEFGKDHPPFGGTKEEYLELFSSHYNIEHMDIASNSIEARKGRELFISLKKQDCLT
ncbi:MAG: SAM-dependent methyltransferase [Flavobacteriales bacterium]|nr:SAM-dependent methyltransferase [Flavobacteriales bacterium]